LFVERDTDQKEAAAAAGISRDDKMPGYSALEALGRIVAEVGASARKLRQLAISCVLGPCRLAVGTSWEHQWPGDGNGQGTVRGGRQGLDIGQELTNCV